MDQKEQILHYYRIDGLSLREISRRVSLNRKTVTRYVREYEASIREDPEKGYNISYSSVCKYIQRRKAEKSKKPKDVFVKQYYEPGKECEFDWGEVKLRIGGKPVTFTMAVFALCHSEGRWAYLFRHQDNLAFMESHRNFFHDVHGVPHIMVYDNMKVAVILKPDGKKPTETLQRMKTFYGFDYRFCNARAGWEKVRVYDADRKKMAEHERSYSHGSWTFDINHYINTLMKKPGALKGSVALRQHALVNNHFSAGSFFTPIPSYKEVSLT